jgi:hypothetical protein
MQKQSVIYDILTHLMTNTENVLKLNAVYESAIWSVYSYFVTLTREYPEKVIDSYGGLILDALVELKIIDGNDDLFMPYKGCVDVDNWVRGIEALADCILWDRDFEITNEDEPVDEGDFDYYDPTIDIKENALQYIREFGQEHGLSLVD